MVQKHSAINVMTKNASLSVTVLAIIVQSRIFGNVACITFISVLLFLKQRTEGLFQVFSMRFHQIDFCYVVFYDG